MTHEFLGIGYSSMASGYEGLPGIMTNNGTLFQGGSWLQQMFGFQNENSGLPFSEPYFPFDRGIQVPNPDTWHNGVSPKWGLYFWVKNQILVLNGTTNNWEAVLTMATQHNLKDYGIHTGLYEVYGSDGRLYVCGMYPSTFGNLYTGAIKLDVETNVWTDIPGQLVNQRFIDCQYCIAWKGKLLLLVGPRLYTYDPVSDVITQELLPTSFTTSSSRLLIMGNRLFGCDKSLAGRLKIFEDVGGVWIEMADLGQITMTSIGCFDYAQTKDAAIFFFNSVETIGGVPMSGYRAVEVTTFDPNPGGALVIDEVTTPVLSGFGQVFSAALNSFPDARFFTCADSSAVPFQEARINIYHQEQAAAPPYGYGQPWATYRWVNKASQLSFLNVAGGGTSYVSSKSGGGGHIFSADFLPTTQRKIVVYKVETADDIVQDGLLVSFWAFGDTDTDSGRIYVNYPTQFVVGSLIRGNGGTIHSVVSGGTLFQFQRIDNIPISRTGGGVHQFIWDRATDNFNPWQAFGLTVDLDD
jgi:hypothetical protein